MDRRNFLTGMLGITGVSLIASVAGHGNALAGVPGRGGVLHLLDEPEPDGIEPEVGATEEETDDATAQPVQERRWQRRR